MTFELLAGRDVDAAIEQGYGTPCSISRITDRTEIPRRVSSSSFNLSRTISTNYCQAAVGRATVREKPGAYTKEAGRSERTRRQDAILVLMTNLNVMKSENVKQRGGKRRLRRLDPICTSRV